MEHFEICQCTAVFKYSKIPRWTIKVKEIRNLELLRKAAAFSYIRRTLRAQRWFWQTNWLTVEQPAGRPDVWPCGQTDGQTDGQTTSIRKLDAWCIYNQLHYVRWVLCCMKKNMLHIYRNHLTRDYCNMKTEKFHDFFCVVAFWGQTKGIYP